ncbi:MAG: type II secretion system protein [Candidatus Gracilibacteria bacterium]|nr:type II secretion system protein [Candidatus Gracilibacteria bacterium]
MQTHKNAFTLIELLVVITIIGILLVGLSKVDISKGQEKEKSLAFSQKIQTILETTRNNALIGKGIGTNLVVPNAWKIEISKQNIVNGGSGIINSYYSTGGNRNPYESLKTDKYYEINKIECINLDGSYIGDVTGTGIIYMTGSELSITSTDTNCDSTKIFKIYSNYKKQFQNKIIFNGVSGVIEKN